MAKMFSLTVFALFKILMCLSICVNTAECNTAKFPSLSVIKPQTSDETQAAAVSELIQRAVGGRSSSFKVQVKSGFGPQDKDTFKLTSSNGVISIMGSSGIAAAMGFYYYTKQFCGCHVSWAGVQMSLPTNLPILPQEGITITTNDKFRYYQNVCTVSYSFVWWNWTQWETHLDWMAMQGINLPLAFNGQEAVFQQVFMAMGLTKSELDGFFGGPAFLAWTRMGNIQGWGGPLPDSWHKQQVALQHQILQRMRSFGMTPVLPAFAGHVPQNLSRIFPKANVTKLGAWGHFTDPYSGTYLIDVQDPLFSQIGAAFLKAYITEFGTDHAYSADTFNELRPASGDTSYLSAAGKSVFSGMTQADTDAIWVMQGWLFTDGFWTNERAKALVTSVPMGKMILLDLFSEVNPQYIRLESYFGQPFIWNMLHDFGGTVSMYGVIESVNTNPFSGRSFANSTMIGIGLTPEGINQNDFIYEFMMENAWVTEPRNLTRRIQSYSAQRYGKHNSYAEAAWQYLKTTVYNCTDGRADHGQEIFVHRPDINKGSDVFYSTDDFFKAWDNMIKAANELSQSALFRYDLVDVTRQAMQVIFDKMYADVIAAYKKADSDGVRKNGTKLLTLLTDLDTVLSTDPHFLLGRWLEDAKSWATNAQEMILYEYNARNQLTLWGPEGNILDYANKQWSGLIMGYYLPRWELFVMELYGAVKEGKAFNSTSFTDEVLNKVEKTFTFDKSLYPTEPTSGCVEHVMNMYDKYRPMTVKDRAAFQALEAKNSALKSFKSGKSYEHYMI